MELQSRMTAILPEWRERVKKLVNGSSEVRVDEVTIGQVFGGMRDIKSMVTDISYVDPNEGIRFRGYTIPEVLETLPKPAGADVPYVGGLYYLLLIGEVPTREQALEVEEGWKARAAVPGYIQDMLRSMPADTHPMVLLSMSVLALQRDSLFTRRYHEGMRKDAFWEPMLEDSLNLTAKLPVIAALIYNLKYHPERLVNPEPGLDYGANFARMLGVSDPQFMDLCRLYLILHSDHESGNASAHATHLAASTLSDIYYAYSAGLNSLAGPLHGLANQESLDWLLQVHKKFNGVPSREELRQYAWDKLKVGQVIPGYGHAVLRKPDPRFTAQYEFASNHLPEDEIFRIVKLVFEVVPQVLIEQGKAKNPSPNVDAVSGSILHHYGVTEYDFYTVMFGVGRALGVTANTVWARALGAPIERPKSLTTSMLEEIANKAKN
jgi:citrate synthase